MKLLTRLFIIASIIMIILNFFQINWKASNTNDNIVAIIGVIASSCALVLLVILLISKKIASKIKK